MTAQIVAPLLARYTGLHEVAQIPPAGGLRRVQTGLQIGNPPDLSITLAINARYLAQLLGLSPLFNTANDDVSRIQTANAAVGSVQARLQRMRAYAVEASGAGTPYDRRTTLQDKMEELVADIDSIGLRTQFNGLQVFNQSRTNQVGDPGMASILGGLKGGWLENAEKLVQTHYGLKADGAPLNIELTSFSDGPGDILAQVSGNIPDYGSGKGSNLTLQIDRADFVPAGLPDGGIGPAYSDRIIAHEIAHAVMSRSMNYAGLIRTEGWFVEGAAEFIHGADERFASDLALAGGNPQIIVDALEHGLPTTSAGYAAAYAAVRYLHAQIKSAGGEGIKDVMDYLTKNQRATLDDAFRNAIAPLGGPVKAYTSADAFLADFSISGAEFIATRMNLHNADTGAIGGFDADGLAVRTAETVVSDIGSRSGDDVLAGFIERFDTGPTGQARIASRYAFTINGINFAMATASPMNASALGISGLNLIDDPADAIGQIDRAIKYVNAERARLGIELARLDTAFSAVNGIFGSFAIGNPWYSGSMTAGGLLARISNGMQSDADAAMQAQANVPRAMAMQLLRTE